MNLTKPCPQSNRKGKEKVLTLGSDVLKVSRGNLEIERRVRDI